jgi:hypothetical protein
LLHYSTHSGALFNNKRSYLQKSAQLKRQEQLVLIKRKIDGIPVTRFLDKLAFEAARILGVWILIHDVRLCGIAYPRLPQQCFDFIARDSTEVRLIQAY